MNDNKILTKLIYGVPRGLSLFLVLVWLIVLVVYGFDHYLFAGIMVWMILVLTTAVCWKNPPIGGVIFILLGAGYLLFAMSNLWSALNVLAAAPLFIVGVLFIGDYIYTQNRENKDGVDDF